MVLHCRNILNRAKLYLASTSPRRAQLLEQMGLGFRTFPPDFAEDLDKSTFKHAKDYVQETARRKALAAKDGILAEPELPAPDVVISADTIVVIDDNILEKPKDAEHAKKMLESLSGRTHQVYTAMAILSRNPENSAEWIETLFVEETSVTFDTLPGPLIDAYVTSGEPLDKAGGYGIQGQAACFVKGINGCYYNVVGLPVRALARALERIAINL